LAKANTKLTPRQQAIMDYITSYISEYGFAPSIREICEGVGLSSSSTAHSHLTTMVRKGYLRRHPSKPRAIEVLGQPGHIKISLPLADREHAVQMLNQALANTPADTEPYRIVLALLSQVEAA
jgi:SOS-response transcriptional repressor LexA